MKELNLKLTVACREPRTRSGEHFPSILNPQSSILKSSAAKQVLPSILNPQSSILKRCDKSRLYALILFFLLMIPSAYSSTVSDLYRVQIPAQSRVESERLRLIQTAIKQVLIKVSGNTNIAKDPGLSSTLNNASHYVREYGYENSPDGSATPLMLEVQFEKRFINQAVIQAGQAVWPENRPLILVFLAVQNTQGADVITDDDSNVYRQLLMSAAKDRGLPIIFPIEDIFDRMKASVSDIQSFHLDPIFTVSKRYSPDAVLIGNMNVTNPSNIQSQWMLISQDKKMRWEIDGTSVDEVIQTEMDNVTNTLARYYAVLENSAKQNQLVFKVVGLDQMSGYASTMNYLKHLTGVDRVEVSDVSSDSVVFNITLNSQVADFQRLLRIDGKLKPVVGSEVEEADELVYAAPSDSALSL